MFTIKNNAVAAQALLASIISSKAIPIFDLDGVILNAEHRQHSYTAEDCNAGICTREQIGQLDLSQYRSNTTAEQVAQDKALPLMDVITGLNALNYPYHVATARVITDCPHSTKLLRDREITPYTLICRQGDSDNRRDSILKCEGIEANFTKSSRARLVLIDDSLGNCQAMASVGVKAIHVAYVPEATQSILNDAKLKGMLT